MKPTVFILDDEQSICEALYFSLQADYAVEYSTNPEQGLRLLRNKSYDVLLLDMRLGTYNGIDILQSVRGVNLDTAVILMTAYGSENAAVEAMKKGAFDFLNKPLDIEKLRLTIERALDYRRLSDDVRFLSDELQERGPSHQMVGSSKSMQHVFRLIDMYKDVDSSVLITGESGTGKELVARSIHSRGKRRNERFVAVNCAAVPDNLLESEFFGHKKGAFTSAVSDQKGKFLMADKGTLFLDEIGDMPLSLQAKILRVLQEKEIVPVGDTKTIPVDVRVIAATNRDLREMVANGTFREDLFYRLNVVSLHMPPLRDRQEDILPLCEHFIRLYNTEQKKNIRGISDSAMQKLLRYQYPGNVRQLANIIEHATILTVGDVIGDLALPEELDAAPVSPDDMLINLLAGKTMEEVERLAITAALRLSGGKKPEAAAQLGISERSLYYKIKEYGLA